jgi:hypothetical protein
MAHILPGLMEQDPTHLPLLQLLLSHKMKQNKSGKDAMELGAVVVAADALITAVNREELAAHFGRCLPTDDDLGVFAKERKVQDDVKKKLVEALVAKAEATMALIELCAPVDAAASTSSGDTMRRSGLIGNFTATKQELEQWVELSKKVHKNKYLGIMAFNASPALALKMVLEAAKEAADDKALMERKAKLLEQLGWPEWAKNERDWLLVKFPTSYQPF